MTTQWYYAQNGKQSGPVAAEQLSNRLSSGGLLPSDLVWSEGMPAWVPAGEVPDLMPPDAGPPTLLRPYVPPPPPGASPAFAPQKLAPAPSPPGPAPAPRMPAPAAAPAFAPRQPAPAPAFAPRQAPAPAPAPAPVPQAWDAMRPHAPAAAHESSGEVTTGVVAILSGTKPWVRFLAVLGFLGLGMLVLGSLAILVMPDGPAGTVPLGAKVAASFIYLLSGLLQLPAILFLNRYASRIAGLVASRDPADLEDALRAQNSFWRYVGILALVMMILGALGTVAAIVIVGAGILTR